ncbi:protein ULTRAPETALA 1-like [Chenopodium quinoa]|uniref:protein ULTRAPETALA 1-like n=1 Tax=Chenopodium quinoa TaxID=63459 RepID=UPI000B76E76F|nr:protein ULTRAPETALA 1-like [Chenopodium quinoa]
MQDIETSKGKKRNREPERDVIVIGDSNDDVNNDDDDVNNDGKNDVNNDGKNDVNNDDEVEIISSNVFWKPEELKGMTLIESNNEVIKLLCGITHPKYGDSIGKISIYRDGRIEIDCDCYPGCKKGTYNFILFYFYFSYKICPSEFEKEAGFTGASNWRGHIWVFVDVHKKSLRDTKLLKYYKGSIKDRCDPVKPVRSRTVHRDEFMKCTACGKRRLFMCRNKDQCKAYHQATKNSATWTCSDFPYKFLRCEDDERRGAKNLVRGCPLKPTCEGCSSCVCFGCDMCRFDDCDCRTCLDYILNIEV